jgi:hypothetical protein
MKNITLGIDGEARHSTTHAPYQRKICQACLLAKMQVNPTPGTAPPPPPLFP